jgi:hypothetical protein
VHQRRVLLSHTEDHIANACGEIGQAGAIGGRAGEAYTVILVVGQR